MIAKAGRRWQPGLRWQLMLWYTCTFALLLLSTGLLFYSYLEDALETGFDPTLQSRAEQIAADIAGGDETIVIRNQEGELPGFSSSIPTAAQGDVNTDALVRIVDISGHTLRETPAFHTLQVPQASVTQPLQGQVWQGTVATTTGAQVRLYSQALLEHNKVFAVIQVGQSLLQMHELLHELVAALIVVGFLVLLLCAFVSYWLAGRAFAPIHYLAQTARKITAGDLKLRVPVPVARDEVQYLALTFNEMIESLDQALVRQRRFVADASHELRTPVAVIRNKAGVALLGKSSPQDSDKALREIRDETERLGHLISDLLALARGDEGQALIEREQVQLHQLAETVVANAETLATERGVTLAFTPGEPVTLIGDEARLIQVIMNLLDNAIRYTNPGGRVDVAVEATSDEARLIVRDTGIGISSEHLPHIFERFYRADAARQRIGGSSSGLGLAIVDWIVRVHGGAVSVKSQVGQGSCFIVSLPRGREKHIH